METTTYVYVDNERLTSVFEIETFGAAQVVEVFEEVVFDLPAVVCGFMGFGQGEGEFGRDDPTADLLVFGE